MFVGEFFAEVRRENPGVSHKEVMGILSRMYKERKEKSGKEHYTVGQGEIDLGKENVGERGVIEIEDDEVVDLTCALEEVEL